ncbi:MAG: LacI family DNA-binding transcriptional regulator [Eubacteriales bacterium]|nr:LacI family DNA-binding transcriptional regulator [Eubacteriales bacterium]
MPKHRATIQDVSRLCGVSTATVSRVINQNGRYSPETERQVRDAITQLGYVPNLAAKNLRMNTTHLVGILVSHLDYEYVNKITTTLEAGLFQQGYIAIVCNVSEECDNEQTYLDAMFALNICALFVFSTGHTIHQPNERHIPVIYINRYPERLSDELCCAIETDSVSAGYKAGAALLDARCKRIAMVSSASSGSGSRPRDREIGFIKALWEHNVPCEKELFVRLPENSQYIDAFQAMNRKLEEGLVADGYFCESDIFALSAIRSLELHHLRVPEDVKVIGCNDMSVATYNNKAITTISHQTDAICELAIANMKRLLAGETLAEKHTVFDVELVRRETT